MKKQCKNPYLPSWEYIPDGEPHVYDGRVYVYGSHDKAGGWVFCLNDYVCWSARVDDLSDWRYEGVIYSKTDDPLNPDGRMCLYAPDVTVGPDGRYYLYYVLDKVSIVSVAVCDTPAGKYEFYGYVHYPDGTRLGERAGDEAQFDPAVLTEGDITYLYTGFCWKNDASRHGAMMTVLEPDMLTVREAPVFVVPSGCYSSGTGFEGHEFFEAPSIRKHGDTYYFIYSSVAMHELCYATSESPNKDFKYGGVIISNCDLHIDSYKAADKHAYPAGNNHGGIAEIDGQWYIFYHRMTNGTWYSRQGCIERIMIIEDGSIPQVEMTSQGASATPLDGCGEYPAYMACNLFGGTVPAKITQYGKDGDEEPAYIADITNSAVIGFKYFKCSGVTKITLRTRGYANGSFAIKTSLDGEPLAQIPVEYTNIWVENTSEIALPDGVHALYFEFTGNGSVSLEAFIFHSDRGDCHE